MKLGQALSLVDHLVRLGIPLAAYCWVLRPALIYLGAAHSSNPSFWAWHSGVYFRDYGIIGGGPLWFIEILFLFSVVYVLARLLTRSRPARPAAGARFPGNGAIAFFALLLGVASFAVRLVFRVDTSFAPLNLQFANFAQYIALFILGLVAFRRNWLAALLDGAGRLWLGIAVLFILLYPPMGLLSGGANNAEPFLGGWHWQSLISAVWEAFLCVSTSIGLVALFRRRLDLQGALARELSRSAYTAYLIHEPVITLAAVAAAGVLIYPLAKFGLAALLLVPLCFALSSLIRRVPGADRVL